MKAHQFMNERIHHLLEPIEELLFKIQIRFKLNILKKKYKPLATNIGMINDLQKKIYYELYGDHSSSNECRDIYHCLLTSRLYQINREFVDLLINEKFHSCNALCRIICEILMVTTYVNLIDLGYSKIISGEKEGKKVEWGPLIRTVKNNEKKPRYWDDLIKHWSIFSDYLHPRQFSFKDSVWWLTKDKKGNVQKTDCYINRAEKDEKSGAVLIHTYPHYVPDGLKQIMINRFFSYSSFI